jgi:hypothetical protein
MSALMPLNCWNTNSMQPISTPLRRPGLNRSDQLASLDLASPAAGGAGGAAGWEGGRRGKNGGEGRKVVQRATGPA